MGVVVHQMKRHRTTYHLTFPKLALAEMRLRYIVRMLVTKQLGWLVLHIDKFSTQETSTSLWCLFILGMLDNQDLRTTMTNCILGSMLIIIRCSLIGMIF